MSIPRKGSRTLSVDDRRYRWYVRHKPTYVQGAFEAPMRVAIERAEATPGSVLLVDLRVSRPDNWIGPHQTALTPAIVRRIITLALRDGWDPDGHGSAFQYEYPLVENAS
jgi:hypothetical protein